MSVRPHHLFVLLVAVVATSLCSGPVRSDEEPARKAAETFAGTWVLRATESDGVSTADDKFKTQALEIYPVYLTVQGTAYTQEISNLAVTEKEEGSFVVVKVGVAFAEVDVSATRRVRGDGPKQPDTKFVAREIWRLVDADTLQRCYPANSARDRPVAFQTKKGDGLVLQTFQRRKQ